MTGEKVSLRISASDWSSLKRGLFTADGNENSAVLLCGISDTDMEKRLLVRRILPVPFSEYTERTTFHLEVAPQFYNRVVGEALQQGLSPVIVHSHPHSHQARYSKSDDYGELRLLPVLQALVPGATVASLVVTPTSVNGRRLVGKGKRFTALNSFAVTGQRSQIILLAGQKLDVEHTSPEFGRQIRAFGAEGQEILEQLKVGIVGVGGTGSIVAEQLARTGIRDFIVIDPDRVEHSNVSRLFGSSLKDVGRNKVEVIAENLIKLGAKNVQAIADTAIRQSVLMLLRDRDLVFSCVDNDRSRSILSRFAYQYLVPVIDAGVRLDGRTGQIRAAAGRVSIVGPGMLCLRCSRHLDSERIRAESLPPEERQNLAREGYVIGIDEPAPAVVSLNTTVAAMAVTAALNLFLNLTGGSQPLDQLYDAMTGIVFVARPRHEQGCDVCDENSGLKALGDKQIVSAYD